jgi:hypothetical protein
MGRRGIVHGWVVWLEIEREAQKMDTVALVFVGALGAIMMAVIFGVVWMMRKPQ